MTDRPSRPYVSGQRAPMPAPNRELFVLLPPYVHGRARVVAPPPRATIKTPTAEMPSIDEFLDELPSIDDFAPTPAAPGVTGADWPRWAGEEAASAGAAEEWGSSDWQRFDWSSASALGGAMPDSAAAQAWAATNWDNPRDPRTSQASAAEALAEALDQIATRIRTGELSVPGAEHVRDDAATAAALAKLLGIRR